MSTQSKSTMQDMLDAQKTSEAPFTLFPEDMPTADMDLAALSTARITPPVGLPEQEAFGDFAVRSRNLARAFAWQSPLLVLNGQCITLLRRADPPPDIAPLFNRLWEEHAALLVAGLPPRWLISTSATFASFGTTPVRKQVGEGLATLFAMLKLSETERLFSNKGPTEPFPPGRSDHALPLGLKPFAMARGDLHRVLLTRLWTSAQADPAITLLAETLILNLLEDPGTVFARFATMRARRRGPGT
jgi:hypothetical protein